MLGRNSLFQCASCGRLRRGPAKDKFDKDNKGSLVNGVITCAGPILDGD